MENKQLIYLKTSEVKPYEKNPRINEGAVDAVAESIKEFGFKNPIIVDKDNVIICGHTRLKAAKKLGLKEVPCIVANDLNEKQVKAFRLADNKTAELAEWDFDMLNLELDGIDDIDMSLFGFDLKEDLDAKEVIEDDIPEVDEENEPTAKYGDVYKLGNHRLMCGDSTKKEDVQTLMGGGCKADLLFTDPPYNVNYVGKTKDSLKIQNDNQESQTFYEFLSNAFNNIEENIKEGGVFYVWYASREHINFEKALNSADLAVREQLIWAKNQFVMGRQDYQWKHEPCFYGWKDGASHYFVDDRTQSTIIEDKGIDIRKLKKEEMKELLEKMLGDKVSTTVIKENKPSVNDLHPTMKPIKLIARLLKNSSVQNEIVLDPFGGSGSTLIACEQLNRKCYMMELDPKYVDVIVKRWETFTGKKAKLINNKEEEEN